jgi:hypothetical protein
LALKKFYSLALRLVIALLLSPVFSYAQDFLKNGEIHGNFQADAQYYVPDKKMGITDSALDGKLLRMNAFTNVIYTNGNFSAGLRFEAYQPPLIGYDVQNSGVGIPYWYVNYKNDKLDITAGNFYDQFGNGMILRTYEEWTLGFDNSIRGIKVKFEPIKGLTLKGLWGMQRNYWDTYNTDTRGIVKGADADLYFNDLVKSMADSKVKLTLGASFASNYLRGKSQPLIYDNKIYDIKLPENVATYGGRENLTIGKFTLYTEYAHKINDPSAMNKYIYNDGNGLYTNLSFSQKGLGASVSLKTINNMSYKSKRDVTSNQLSINYLPTLTKEHTYSLAAMYPYGTQANGEFGFQGSVIYNIPKNSKLGGKRGMTIDVNYAQVNSNNTYAVNDTTPLDQPGTLGHKTHFFQMGDIVYYQDFNVEVTKKFSKKWLGIFTYLNQTYNKDVIEGHVNEYGHVYANIGIADVTYNITTKHSIRAELQGLWTKQDQGDWMAFLAEYTISPAWFFSIQDQWNYGNTDASLRIHYFLVNAGYTYHTTRISLSYGRQRAGLLCVGGVCRYVPAASGATLTITSSF